MKIKKKSECRHLSTGCTLLNLAISDIPTGGFEKGKYYFFVGDSASGKTFFCMTCFAEACRSPAFKHYRRIYDNIEDGMLMNCAKLFGTEVDDLIEPPAREEGEDRFSETIEEFYFHIDDAIKKGEPFIYVLDSMDGLDASDDQKKFEEHKKAHKAGKKASGSYGMAKAKANSVGLRKVLAGLRDTGSILVIISQTRSNVGFGFETKTRSGGHALKFYATAEIWSSLGGQIKRTILKKKRKIGDKIILKIKKNRHTGKNREVWSAIYPSYGIDDIGSNVDYLMDEGWWKKAGTKIKAKEFRLDVSRSLLIRAVEKDPKKILKLQGIVGKCWEKVESASALDRRARYE